MQLLTALYLIVVVAIPCKRADRDARQFCVAAIFLCDAGPSLVSHEPGWTELATGESSVRSVSSVVARIAGVPVVVNLTTSDALFSARNPHLLGRYNFLFCQTWFIAYLAFIVNIAPVGESSEGGAMGADAQHPLTALVVPTPVLRTRTLLRTLGWAHVRILVVFDVNVAVVPLLLHNLCPIHCVHVTQGRILFNSYSAVHDMRESSQAYIRHPRILEDSKCVKLDKLVPAYDSQSREDVLERDDLICSV